MLTLWRHYRPEATTGVLFVRPGLELHTLERPWRWNKPQVSCVPEGLYPIVRGNFKALYPNFELEDEEPRSAIEIHRANRVQELEGCIALGMSLTFDAQGPLLAASKDALDAFMRALEGLDRELLWITRSPGGR